jgi:hypothetical protein
MKNVTMVKESVYPALEQYGYDAETTIMIIALFCASVMLILIMRANSSKPTTLKRRVSKPTQAVESVKFSAFGMEFEIKKQGANVLHAIKLAYPGALDNKTLVTRMTSALEKFGYTKKNTLVATSLCCDEVNRELEKEIGKVYGDNFSMGGLAGFPFCGKTSFGAMAHHIPEDGSCVVVYGPHVGIDSEGNIGKVNRRGRKGSGACCGSATAACGYVKGVKSGAIKKLDTPTTTDDAQQVWVSNLLLPYVDRLTSARNEAAELPLCLFSAQEECMNRIVSSMCAEVAGIGKIALLGGIQINTPEGTPDYFLPLKFEVRNNKGKSMGSLMESL